MIMGAVVFIKKGTVDVCLNSLCKTTQIEVCISVPLGYDLV